MKRAVRLVGAVALACASVPLVGVGSAYADTAALVPTNSAYFYAEGLDKPADSPADPPNLTAEADGVSAGNLAVAAKAGVEDKASFLAFDLFNLPTGATIDKAVVTMTLVPASPTDVSFNNTPELVQACKAGSSGFLGEDGDGLVLAPERLCAAFSAKGTAAAGGLSYQWDVTGLAQSWLAGTNDGIAFTRADEAPGTNFQVVFGHASTAKLDVTYTPEQVAIVDPVDPVLPDAGLPAVSGYVPPPTDTLTPSDFAAPLAPEPVANPAPQPAAPVASAPRQAIALSTSMRPATSFWLAGLGLAGVLALISLVMGDPRVPAAQRSTSRLSLALADRQRLVSAPVMRARHL